MSRNGHLRVPAAVGGFDGGSDTRSDTRSQHGGSQYGGSQHGGSQRGGSQHGGSQHSGSESGTPPRGPARSRSGSASSQRSAPPSPQAGPSREGAFPPGLGYDPARQPGSEQPQETEKYITRRIDLPPEAYAKPGNSKFAARPGLNTVAGGCRVQVNAFRVEAMGDATVFTYDIQVSPIPKSGVIFKKLWESDPVQQALAKFKDHVWIHDGRALVWSKNWSKDGIRMEVDLDVAQGKDPRKSNKKNVFFFKMVPSGKVDMSYLQNYLAHKCDWSEQVLAAMNFLDHALRDVPSKQLIAIGRNYYDPGFYQKILDNSLEAVKGIYAAFRLANNLNLDPRGLGLSVNVDVTNTCFWVGQIMEQVIPNFFGNQDRMFYGKTLYELSDMLCPTPGPRDEKTREPIWEMSQGFRLLRKLQRLKFFVKHRGKMDDDKTYTIARFAWDPARFGKDGGNAKAYTFTMKATGEKRSVYEHFLKQYNIRLKYWRMPVIETSRGGAFPMEVLEIPRFQRYPYKLTPDQTAEMIKFAVTRPQERKKAIMGNVEALGWNRDPTLKDFGIKISQSMPVVNARLIAPPDVQYKTSTAKPAYAGRWDLRNKVFLQPNQRPLKSWCFVVINKCVDEPTLARFADAFIKAYKAHGGVVPNTKPLLRVSPVGESMPVAFESAYMATGKANNASPDLLFFVMPQKEQFAYERLKKNAECRFATLTQMVLHQHVKKAQPQYCSNVAMKVNCKLGGVNCKVVPPMVKGKKPNFYTKPTMFIGADVSHPGVGSEDPSFAAMTVSMDLHATFYAAACQTNGYREEIIRPINIESMLKDVVKKWKEKLGFGPAHVFYFRDGVSEGQFDQVLSYETNQLKVMIARETGVTPKITTIVATKRHHIRFFPERGDKNGNPLPGTVVETEVTHPFHYDFYLCSHVAIQGTARPVHYHVIEDEVKMPVDMLQSMIYYHCYQYQRSTTPVSLHPAVYYAHLAGARCKAHQDIASSKKNPFYQAPKNWFHKHEKTTGPKQGDDARPILPFGTEEARPDNANYIKGTMWYI